MPTARRTSRKVLPKDEYVWLAENGFVRTAGEYDGDFQPTWQTVSFANAAIREKLLSIGKRLREKHRTEWDELRGNYVREVLKTVPAHLSRVKEFELQFLFNSVVSDPRFCLHCIRALLDNGKLQPPAEEQKKTLTVHRATVKGDSGFITKQTGKTDASSRVVPIIIPQLVDALKRQADKSGPVVKGYPNTLYNQINRLCVAHGLPQVGVHGLRHSFASLCHHLGVPEMECARMGGWSDLGTMRKIYTHLSEQQMSQAAERLTGFFR